MKRNEKEKVRQGREGGFGDVKVGFFEGDFPVPFSVLKKCMGTCRVRPAFKRGKTKRQDCTRATGE